MELIIRNTTNQPIYDQIYSQIKAQIIAGKLSPGEALPSIRALAKDLRISVITTKRAYDELEADGFLYNMVRAIVGTMVYASYGKIEPEAIPALLATRDRRLTGPTMPPQGLYLNRVWYDGAVGDMMNQA